MLNADPGSKKLFWFVADKAGAYGVAGLPALTVLMASTGEIFGGSILAEQVFAWPGLGRATIEAGMKGDVPLLTAIALLTALIVSSANRVADRIYPVLDPRMRGAT